MNFQTRLIGTLLGGLRSLASSVLRLFNLGGGVGTLPLRWISEHWISLLVILLIIGVVGDILVWLLRWRPHWAWFRKKRILVRDAGLLEDLDEVDNDAIFDGEEESKSRHRQFIVSKGVEKRRAPEEEPPKPKPVARKKRAKPPVKRVPQTREDYFEVGEGGLQQKEDEVFNIKNLTKKAE